MKRLLLGLGLTALAPFAAADSVTQPAPVITTPVPADDLGQPAVVTVTPAVQIAKSQADRITVQPVAEPVPVATSAAPAVDSAQLADRVAKLEALLKNSGGLLELLSQVQAMHEQIRQLRGTLEELTHEQKVADKRQKDLFADLEDRQNKLKDGLAGLDSKLQDLASRTLLPKDAVRLQSSDSLSAAAPVPDAASEAKTYEAALDQFKVGNYTAAVESFQSFLKLYPNGAFASNGDYWLGLSYFSLGDYKSAAASQLRLLRDFPQSPKVPDAMVSLARAQIQLGELDAARSTLDQVLDKYPVTRAADAARKMQVLLK